MSQITHCHEFLVQHVAGGIRLHLDATQVLNVQERRSSSKVSPQHRDVLREVKKKLTKEDGWEVFIEQEVAGKDVGGMGRKVDILCRHKSGLVLLIEVDGPFHHAGLNRLNGPTQLRNSYFKHAGLKLLTVVYSRWAALRTSADKQDFLTDILLGFCPQLM